LKEIIRETAADICYTVGQKGQKTEAPTERLIQAPAYIPPGWPAATAGIPPPILKDADTVKRTENFEEATMGTQSPDNGGTSHWPALEEQLATSRVVRGSALEGLIRDNQDFHMLRPEEAHDQLRVPVWLRVYWRKLHPDADYSAPSGGYPLTLVDLHEWMMQHQDLLPPAADVEDPNDPRHAGKYSRPPRQDPRR
jgi:hypothetical protein